jgi:hypothetical protein
MNPVTIPALFSSASTSSSLLVTRGIEGNRADAAPSPASRLFRRNFRLFEFFMERKLKVLECLLLLVKSHYRLERAILVLYLREGITVGYRTDDRRAFC